MFEIDSIDVLAAKLFSHLETELLVLFMVPFDRIDQEKSTDLLYKGMVKHCKVEPNPFLRSRYSVVCFLMNE